MITVSTRSRAEVAAGNLAVRILAFGVSTHSRAEAAALHKLLKTWRPCGFNTQPPEGGYQRTTEEAKAEEVSTHSRAKAAA